MFEKILKWCTEAMVISVFMDKVLVYED